MGKWRILLLNPPGSKIYNRDYYCSSISKTHYYWHPIDLLVLNVLLKYSYYVYIIDSIAEKLNKKQTFLRIKKILPDILIFLSSSLSFQEDLEFINSINSAKKIACGDIFLEPEFRNEWLEKKIVDGVILDFTNSNIQDFVSCPQKYNNILSYENKKFFSYPVPEHKKFPLKKYRYPYQVYHPFISILTNYGCPYKCYFCNSGSFGFKLRDIGNIIEEIKYATQVLKVRHIFFKDMTFAVDKKHTEELLKEIIKNKFNITYNCYSRVELIDEELAHLLKRSGCHIIQFGIETVDTDLLQGFAKKTSLKDAISVVKILKKHGILAGTHFIFGLPGSSLTSIKETIDFVLYLEPDYVSFNIYEPRYGSKLSKVLPQIDKKLLEIYRNLGYRKFYLRPKYLLNRIFKAKSLYELINNIYLGIGLVRG